jgi:hypothetical protein
MKSITYFAPHKTALTFAVLFAIMSLIFIIPMAILLSLVTPEGAGLPIGMMLAMPIIYFVMGYLSTALMAWIYNKVANYTGGITFKISE